MLAQLNFSQTILQIAHKAKDRPMVAIEQSVERVVVLIKESLLLYSIEDAARNARGEILALREKLIDFLSKNEFKKATEGDQATINRLHAKLAKVVAEVLSMNDKIFASIAEKAGFDQYGHLPLSALQEYDLPKFSNVAIRVWIEKSIDFEFSLIVAALVINGELKMKREKVTELITFMDETICSYGAHTILFGLWPGPEEDRSRLAWNMELLSRTLEIDYNRGYRLDQDGNRKKLEAWN